LVLVVAVAWPIRWQLFNAGRAARLAFDPAPVVLPVPVEGVKPADLEDTWGGIRSGGRHHEGVDIFAPRGSHVTAAARGFVTGRGWNRLGGRFVQVFGAGRRSYYYAHLDAFDEADVGDWVEVGDLLGYVGTSGNANGTPPHLHFGVYLIGSRAINPYPLLAPNPPVLQEPPGHAAGIR
jgi:murein DD-endopeptidase MepM/ murein hydrolase activator NlpD